MQPEEKLRVAYHESGHALVAYSLPNTDPVHKVSIIPRGLAALGYTMQRPEQDRFLMTRSELDSRIQVLLAGTVAEEMVFEDISSGAQNDLGARYRDRPQHGDGLRHEPPRPRQLPRKAIAARSLPPAATSVAPAATANRRPARSTRK